MHIQSFLKKISQHDAYTGSANPDHNDKRLMINKNELNFRILVI